MILKKITLAPFAGINKKSVEFSNGLNVILGPNESGKSTLVNAVTNLFYTPANLTAAKFNKEIKERFIPRSGGDFIKVILEFLYQNENHTLEKVWGSGKFSKLTLPENIQHSNDNEIQNIINEILGFNQNIYENVLIVRQTELKNILLSLKNNSPEGEAIQEILRKNNFLTGGVSVEKLKDNVNQKVEDYYLRWDKNLDRPEGNRDFDNPWVQNPGKILKSYYNKREIQNEVSKIEKYENELNEILSQLNKYESELLVAQEFVNKYSKLYEDTEKREIKETKRNSLLQALEQIQSDHKEWILTEDKLPQLKKDFDKLESKLSAANEEVKKADEYDKAKSLIEKYNKISHLKSEYDLLQNEFVKLKQISKKDIQNVERISKEIQKSTIKLEAQKLNLSVLAKSNSTLRIFENNIEKDFKNFSAGENFESEINGKLQLETDSLKISVSNGEENIDEILEDLEKNKIELSKILNEFDVKDQNELASKFEVYHEKFNELKYKDENIIDELNGETFDDLKEKYIKIKDLTSAESLKESLEKKNLIESDLKDAKREYNAKLNLLEEFIKKYTDQNSLFNSLAENKSRLKQIEDELSAMSVLPEEFDSAQSFLDEFVLNQKKINELNIELAGLKKERNHLEENPPEYTLDEAYERLTLAEENYEHTKKEAVAYEKIQKTLNVLLDDLDKNTLKPMHESVNNFISKLSYNKYDSVQFNETTPKNIGDNEVPINLLSEGTKDLIALSIRLAMANYFLKDRKGFLILDDPLINLDPERQQAAVNIIQNYAKEKQVILLTCHPSHAEKFNGGSIIKLN